MQIHIKIDSEKVGLLFNPVLSEIKSNELARAIAELETLKMLFVSENLRRSDILKQ